MNGDRCPSSTASPSGWSSRPLRLRVGLQVAHLHRGDDLRRLDAYWVQRGWAADGPIKVASRIDTAARAAFPSLARGDRRRGLGPDPRHLPVEVRVDDGAVDRRRPRAAADADLWRQWVLRARLPPGRHTVTPGAPGDRRRDATRERGPTPSRRARPAWHTAEVHVTLTTAQRPIPVSGENAGDPTGQGAIPVTCTRRPPGVRHGRQQPRPRAEQPAVPAIRPAPARRPRPGRQRAREREQPLPGDRDRALRPRLRRASRPKAPAASPPWPPSRRPPRRAPIRRCPRSSRPPTPPTWPTR